MLFLATTRERGEETVASSVAGEELVVGKKATKKQYGDNFVER